MNNMKKTVFITLLLSIVSLPTAKAEVTFPTVSNFTLDDKIDRYDTGSIFSLINGAADVFLNYHFQEMYHAVYRAANSTGYIIAEAYRHKNADFAYGMYVMERTSSTNFVAVGAQGYIEPGVLNASGSEWYIKIYSHQRDEATEMAIKAIAKGLEKNLFPNAAIPAEVAWLPAENRVAESDMFVPNEVLGLKFLSEAYTSAYDGGAYELFVFKKESAEELNSMIAAYCEWAKSNCQPTPGILITVNDRYNGSVYLLTKNSYAAMVVGIEDAAQALAHLNKLIERVP